MWRNLIHVYVQDAFTGKARILVLNHWDIRDWNSS